MEAKKMKVEKIVVKMKDQELELTPDEARELKQILADLLGDNNQPIYVPQPYPVYPTRWRWWEPYWGTTTSGSGITYTVSSANI